MLYDTVIIGAGAAGYTAAIYAARAGMSAVVIEKNVPGGQLITAEKIENYPGFSDGVSGVELAGELRRASDKFGVNTVFTDVEGYELNGKVKTVHTSMGDFKCKTVIYSAGKRTKKTGLEREDYFVGRGLSYCAVCDAMFYKDKTVTVIGGGNTALSYALFLSEVCREVIIIHRKKELRAEEFYISAVKNHKNITFMPEYEPVRFIGSERIENLEVLNKNTSESKTIKCDGVFVCIGYLPNTKEISQYINTDEKGYIIAGEDTVTNIEGVFAAGDVRKKPLHQIVTAVCDGAVAATQAKNYIEGRVI